MNYTGRDQDSLKKKLCSEQCFSLLIFIFTQAFAVVIIFEASNLNN